jgi:hypothetical protein
MISKHLNCYNLTIPARENRKRIPALNATWPNLQDVIISSSIYSALSRLFFTGPRSFLSLYSYEGIVVQSYTSYFRLADLVY